jgi:hypothetical protein
MEVNLNLLIKLIEEYRKKFEELMKGQKEARLKYALSLLDKLNIHIADLCSRKDVIKTKLVVYQSLISTGFVDFENFEEMLEILRRHEVESGKIQMEGLNIIETNYIKLTRNRDEVHRYLTAV